MPDLDTLIRDAVEIDASELTLMVMPIDRVRRPSLVHPYPVDLSDGADDAEHELGWIAELEGLRPDQLEIVGVRLPDPDCPGQDIDIDHQTLVDARWILGDGGLSLAHDPRAILRHLHSLHSIEVPLYQD